MALEHAGAAPIDSTSTGDPARFRSLDDLERALAMLPPPPAERGRVALIVRRIEGARRQILDRIGLAIDSGVPGDAWGRHPARDPARQLATMQLDVARLIANGQPLELFGDNLFLELDLSSRNLPLGSRLRAGSIVFEVTPAPHNGCRKFRARCGDAALRFVASPALRSRNFRGIYLRVATAGELACGDGIEVLSRPGPDGGPMRRPAG